MLSPKERWQIERPLMERFEIKSHPRQRKAKRHWYLVELSLKLVHLFLRVTGLIVVGKRIAYKVRLRDAEFSYPDLPVNFDGYQILLITDPHFDVTPEMTDAIIRTLPKEPVDLVVLAGDYRNHLRGAFQHLREPLKRLTSALEPRNGFVAVLGNHDSCEMVPLLEEVGIRVLVNETMSIKREEQAVYLTGLDDVHYYYTKMASEALKSSPSGFKIVVVHSNEIAPEAARWGYRLYLCGHTHGGQICLPTGIPIVKHTDMARRLCRGFWRIGDLSGFTSCGAGVVTPPVRFFSEGEVVRITLRGSGGVAFSTLDH